MRLTLGHVREAGLNANCRSAGAVPLQGGGNIWMVRPSSWDTKVPGYRRHPAASLAARGVRCRCRYRGRRSAAMAEARSASSGDMPRSLLAVLDFDGTVTVEDCLQEVLRRHLPADQSELPGAVPRRQLTPVAAVQGALAELRLSPAQVIAEYVDAAVLLQGFAAFVEGILANGGRVAVISLGFREGIERIWQREGLPRVDVFASKLAYAGLALSLVPCRRFGSCERCGPQGCKGNVVRGLRRPGELVAAFGNGSADLCLAAEADVVFARGHLARLCDQQGTAYFALEDYNLAWGKLRDWWRVASVSPAHLD